EYRGRYNRHFLARANAYRPEPAIRWSGRGIGCHESFRFVEGGWARAWPAEDRYPTPPPRPFNRFFQVEVQPGDDPVPYFSYWKDDLFHVEHSGVNPRDVGHSNGLYPPGSVLDHI